MHRILSLLLSAATALAQAPLVVELTPRNKPAVQGQWTVAKVSLKTDFGSAVVDAAKLASVEFGQPDVVTTVGGTQLEGLVEPRTIEIKVAGKAQRFPTNDLTSLVVLRDGATAATSFGGEWMTSFGPAKLEQSGVTVKGGYGFGSDRLEGKVRKTTLEGTFQGQNGGGKVTLELQSDGTFTGSYEANGEKGFWGGYRKQAKTPALEPGKVVEGQTAAGLRCHVRAPKGHGAGKKWPAICILHGSNMTSRAYVDTIVATWPELAEQYIVVGLDGERLSSGSKPGAPVFNYTYINFGGPGQGPAFAHRQSPALVAESLQELGKSLPITRWFVGGHSQGGFLCYCMVMFYPELLAGAFPMSCNLLVQCEPGDFAPEAVAAQHRVAVAVVHGKRDDVVDYDGGAYCHMRMLDGGFPSVRLFAPEQVGHQFAWLPVADAVTWLARSTADDAGQLVAFAEQQAEDKAWRDVAAALWRLAALRAEAALSARIAALEQRIDAEAAPVGGRLAAAIAKNQDGTWVDEFLAFRAEFAHAKAAEAAMSGYARLRRQQQKVGDELFYEARGKRDKAERMAIWQRILNECYATGWYPAIKLWMQ
jgi:poly(3-hydroxybutyrate) depolymerase